MIETKNTIIYNRYKDDISLIHIHTDITAEEILDKMNNLHFRIDFKTTYEEREKKIMRLKNYQQNTVN
jgi:hypothetical protein